MEKIKVDKPNPEEVAVFDTEATVRNDGKWIDGVDTKTCSECGYVLHGWAVRQEFKYCPNCGIPMTAE